jgi:toxin ParE1/3/4
MNYAIVRTDRFADQLNDLLLYVADDSGSVDTALHYLDQIETTILRLRDFPESGSMPRYSLLRRQGYRVLILQRHLVFYKVDHDKKRIVLYAIVDSRREYRNLI